MKPFRIEIITTVERNEAISLVREAIGASEGWIVTHQLFSNLSASIVFEMPNIEAENLLSRLKDAGFSLKVEGGIPHAQRDAKGAAKGEMSGFISLTFIHDEPDMKRDVPAFG